ncbi:MAG: Rha family transcriptional regulator [Comamonadaceae bacterium]|nr:Rha family transcriptional regulator [Comamonadaceae bacterium]
MMPATRASQDAPLVLVMHKSDAYVDSRDMAKNLGNKHQSVFELITNYVGDFEQLGKAGLKPELHQISKTGQTVKYVLLNEDQSYLLLTYSRNTVRVRHLKVRLVKAFKEARRAADIHKTEYLPEYHALHDEVARVAAGSTNGRLVHMNFNKLVNKAVGIQSGQRATAQPITQSMLTVVQTVATQAMRGTTDHHEAYQRAKSAVGNLTQCLQLEASSD